jgi:hypothetical protein
MLNGIIKYERQFKTFKFLIDMADDLFVEGDVTSPLLQDKR